jgi:hypothetical protein
MALITATRAESGVLYATVSGAFSLPEGESSFLQVLKATARHQCGKVLIDGRQVKGDPTTIQRFLYGSFAAESVATCTRTGKFARTPQFAYVLHEPVLDPERFGETVALNRGMWIKAFDNLDEARAWLSAAPASRADAGTA